MKIEYMRNMQFGYMRMELAKPLSKTEEEMLAHNIIEGLLPVCWQQENDKYLLRYDITGKQDLDGLLENTLVDEKVLKSVLVGIYVTVKQLEKHLLTQEGLLLLPEAIFWDHKTETVHFCYFPEKAESLQGRLTKLMEYMLAKTDHKNILAVQLAYGVYEELQKAFFCMEDLQACLQGKNVLESGCMEGMVKEEAMEEEMYCLQELQMQKQKEVTCVEMQKWKNRIMAWINEKVQKILKKQKAEEVVVFHAEDVILGESATTILGVGQDGIVGTLKYEGANSLPDISITKVPFLIGSASNCDGIICHPNISRNHAKITYRDNTYFIEDLNSTNGTRVNGGLLNYKTKVSLKKNMSIYFANEPFCFL